MPRRRTVTPTQSQTRKWASMSRRRYLVAILQEIHGDIDGARERGQYPALAALLLRAASARDELDAYDAPKKPTRDAADMTPEQRATANAADAAVCELSDLEVYVREWTARLKLRLVVTDGMPVLERDTKELRIVRG